MEELKKVSSQYFPLHVCRQLGFFKSNSFLVGLENRVCFRDLCWACILFLAHLHVVSLRCISRRFFPCRLTELFNLHFKIMKLQTKLFCHEIKQKRINEKMMWDKYKNKQAKLCIKLPRPGCVYTKISLKVVHGA